MTYLILRIMFFPIFRIFLKKIQGIKNIPNKRPFIVIANHESRWDHILVLLPILKKLNKKVHFIAVPTWWYVHEKIYRQWAGAIPLFNPKQAYKEAKELIEAGEIVAIFPEGRFERKKRRENPKTGAIRLALETNTPILPMGLRFSYKPFSSTTNVGKLIYLSKNKNIKKQTLDLIKHVYKLKNELS